jgi:hypothetical protein
MAEQKAKREAFMKERMENKETQTEPSKQELKARKQKMKEAKKLMDTKLKSILSPEQYEKWNSFKDEEKAKMNEKRKEEKEN